MARIREEDYAYATARVRAVEIHLLDALRLDRMLEAPTLADSVKQLTDARYGEGTTAESGWETLLDGEMSRVYSFLKSLMPDSAALDVFRLREDYLNAKRMLKAMYQGRDVASAGGAVGTVSSRQLADAIMERRMSGLPQTMWEALQEAMDAFGKRSDPRDIDLVLDRAVFRHMGELAEQIGHPFLVELIALMTDMANIRICIRGKLAGEEHDFFRRAVLDGGLVDAGKFREVSDKTIETFLESIRHTWFGEAAITGMEGYRTGRGISWLEKQLDDRLMAFVHRARYVAMGLEPMVGFLMAKETEIRNARIIFTGKVNHLSHDEIRERLRMAYV